MRPATDDAIAAAAAGAFGVPTGAEISFIKRRENVVFRVRAPGVDRSLRLHRPGYRTDAELASEAAALEAFGDAGVTVPAPVHAPDGRVLVTIEHTDGRRQATMQQWIDGGRVLGTSNDVFLGRARPTDRDLVALGAAAARMHLVAVKGFPPGHQRPSWNAAGVAGVDALWGDPARLAALRVDERATIAAASRRVGEVLAATRAGPDDFGMIHADLTFENVLTTPRGLAVLDFDDSGYGWYLFDIVTPFLWCTPHPDATAMLDALVTGYRTVRPLDPDPELWHALLLGRGMSYLGWAADRPADPASSFIEERLTPWVLDAARRYLTTGGTGWPAPAAPGARTT